MLKQILESMFGCMHSNLTWPQSPRRTGPLNRFQRKEIAHRTCTSCGAEFSFDPRTMKTGKRIDPPAQATGTTVRQEEV